jgi:ubiquitin C-terminal hydrolase
VGAISVKNFYISRVKSLPKFKEDFCKIASGRAYKGKVDPLNIRLWKISPNLSLDQLKTAILDKVMPSKASDALFLSEDVIYLEYNEAANLEDIDLADTDTCIIEICDASSPWIFEVKKLEQKDGRCEFCNMKKILRYFCTCKDVWYCSDYCKERGNFTHKERCKKRFEVEESDIKESQRSRKGLTGLQNLGNTCFMNTALQCMSNCYELTQYFLKDYYKSDINYDNPIGTGGVLAKAYANFLKNVWFGDSHVFSPWNFKRAIATFQSMFSGYQQHDTQEFLNFLLDGLHEDLNKVQKKPMVEKDESDKIDEIKSKDQWIGFLRRNQSALVDLLYGQFKSTLHCPDAECQNVSTTFDPFLSVSLPLAARTETYEIKCFFIFHDLKVSPLQLKLPFSTEVNIMALRNKIGKILKVHPFSFFIIKMDSQGQYDHIVHSSALLKTNTYYVHENSKAFFLFQIDPELFYSDSNKYTNINPEIKCCLRDYANTCKEIEERDEDIQKLFKDDYEEDENGATTESLCYYSRVNIQSYLGSTSTINMRVNTDDNYGFSNDFLKVMVHLQKYEEKSYSNNRTRIIFPRIIYIRKSWTTRQLHFYIFNYMSNIIRIKHGLNESEWPSDRLWEKYFDKLNVDNEDDSLEQQRKNGWPYRLRFKNNHAARYADCYFCGSKTCKDCLLPFDSNLTIGELVSKIPLNDNKEIDNNYLFLNEKQKSLFGHNNRDLQIETSWLPDYEKEVHDLNEKTDIDFKSQLAKRCKSVSIYDCFKNFVKLEKLEENNEWFCSQCKKHQKATKKMEIYKPPHILIIHLKRFKNNSKIDTLVEFPIEGLDISNYVISKEPELALNYDLFAISNHYGSMGFGHYIAYAKNPINAKWYEFDDSHVSEKSESDLIGTSAYVLFYRRRDVDKLIDLESIYTKKFINFEEKKEDEKNNESTETVNPTNTSNSHMIDYSTPITDTNNVQNAVGDINLAAANYFDNDEIIQDHYHKERL